MKHIAIILFLSLLFVSCVTTKTVDNSNISDIVKEAYVIQEKDLADLEASATSKEAIAKEAAEHLETISASLDELEKTVAAEKAEEYANGYKAGYEQAINDVRAKANAE